MGVWKLELTSRWRGAAVVLAAAIVLPILTGCQQKQQVTRQKLIDHVALIDFTGLKPVEAVDSVKVQAAVPRQWEQLALQSNRLYTHQQWRSPSSRTGVGVAHVRLPFPLSTRMLLWLAKREYKSNDGRVISEWTDDLGRPWFEAENDKYRVRGFVVVNGFQAWVIYFGHKSKEPPDPAELSLAARAATSVVPNIDGNNGKVETPTEAPAPQAQRTASAR